MNTYTVTLYISSGPNSTPTTSTLTIQADGFNTGFNEGFVTFLGTLAGSTTQYEVAAVPLALAPVIQLTTVGA